MQSNRIIYSGIWNIGIAAFMLYPPLYHSLGMNLTQPLWGLVDRRVPAQYRRNLDHRRPRR